MVRKIRYRDESPRMDMVTLRRLERLRNFHAQLGGQLTRLPLGPPLDLGSPADHVGVLRLAGICGQRERFVGEVLVDAGGFEGHQTARGLSSAAGLKELILCYPRQKPRRARCFHVRCRHRRHE